MKHITNLVVKLIQEKEREGERTNVSGLDCWKQGQWLKRKNYSACVHLSSKKNILNISQLYDLFPAFPFSFGYKHKGIEKPFFQADSPIKEVGGTLHGID